jgi:tetratricopeptide (TPR) repeat protein
MQITFRPTYVALALCFAAASVAMAGQTPPPQAPPPAQEPPVAQGGLVAAKSPVSIEPSVELFATMCALDAAGFDPDGGGTPARVRLRAQMEGLHGPAVDALRKFYQGHILSDPGATLSRYVAYALEMGPPPAFEIQVHEEDISPDALALEGFGEVLSNFYIEAHIDDIWQQVEPQYVRAADNVAGPIANVVYVTSGYLREVMNPSSPQKFNLYIEPLVGSHSNFLNLGDQYAFVLDPARELPVVEIRHAFLHFFLDPLAYRFHNAIAADAPLLNFAERAPRLPPEYQNDFASYYTECLVRAVELRLDRPSDLEARLAAEDADGYVLVRPLVAQLMKFEKTQPPIHLFYPDIAHGIDVAAESKRLAGVQFAARTADSDVPQAHVGYADAADLNEGETDIAANNGAAAVAAFQRVLDRHPADARATFGLAFASLLVHQADRAQQLFEQIVAAGAVPGSGTDHPDARMISWSHVYLGRLYDVQGDRDHAVAEYRAALAVDGAPDQAKAAAQHGVDQSFQTPKRADDPGNAHR